MGSQYTLCHNKKGGIYIYIYIVLLYSLVPFAMAANLQAKGHGQGEPFRTLAVPFDLGSATRDSLLSSPEKMEKLPAKVVKFRPNMSRSCRHVAVTHVLVAKCVSTETRRLRSAWLRMWKLWQHWGWRCTQWWPRQYQRQHKKRTLEPSHLAEPLGTILTSQDLVR